MWTYFDWLACRKKCYLLHSQSGKWAKSLMAGFYRTLSYFRTALWQQLRHLQQNGCFLPTHLSEDIVMSQGLWGERLIVVSYPPSVGKFTTDGLEICYEITAALKNNRQIIVHKNMACPFVFYVINISCSLLTIFVFLLKVFFCYILTETPIFSIAFSCLISDYNAG